MKIYVVGQGHADPDRWDYWSPTAIVIADDPEHAREIVGDLSVGSGVAELGECSGVPKSGLLMYNAAEPQER